MSRWRTEWMKERVTISASLADGALGAGYGEAVILLCSAISAVAAELWPGKGKDKARFVELLVHSGAHAADFVSVPLLVDELRRLGDQTSAKEISGSLSAFQPSRVITSIDTDKSESEISSKLAPSKLRIVRSCSFAALLYQEVRSGYVHQFRAGARSSSWPMSTATNIPASYVNTVDSPRQIHFNIPWIAETAIHVAEFSDACGEKPKRFPTAWWIDGYV